MKLYNCKILCSFEFCFDFNEEDIERQQIGAVERIKPSATALAPYGI